MKLSGGSWTLIESQIRETDERSLEAEAMAAKYS